MPVRRSLGDRIHAQHAAPARPVLDHHRLRKDLLERRLHRARDGVGTAAGREGNEKANGFVRKGLRPGWRHRAGGNAKAGDNRHRKPQKHFQHSPFLPVPL